MIESIYSAQEARSDCPVYVKNSDATVNREAFIFDVYSDSDESSLYDNLDLIIDALAQLQAKSCGSRGPTELPNRLRVVASIDHLPYQHGTPLAPVRGTASGGTELADYDSDLDNYYPERLKRAGFQKREPDSLYRRGSPWISSYHIQNSF